MESISIDSTTLLAAEELLTSQRTHLFCRSQHEDQKAFQQNGEALKDFVVN